MMTSEKAIQLLHRLQDEQFDGIHGDERRGALSMAVRALEPNLSNNGSICTKTGVNDEDRTTDDCISRKMAIETVSNMFAVTATQKDMVEDCLEILENLPSLKFATDINVGDTIYRQDAIDALAKWFYDVFGIKESDGTATIFKRLRELPSAQPQRMKSRWIHDGYDNPHGVDWMHCSVCGRREPHVPAAMTNFCPSCGADMRGDER